jgi:hypothetical protein
MNNKSLPHGRLCSSNAEALKAYQLFTTALLLPQLESAAG